MTSTATDHVTWTPEAVEDLRVRTRSFIRDVVLPAEARPGRVLGDDALAVLRSGARDAGVFAPHAPVAPALEEGVPRLLDAALARAAAIR